MCINENAITDKHQCISPFISLKNGSAGLGGQGVCKQRDRGTGCPLWDRGVIHTIWQKQYKTCTYHIATQDKGLGPRGPAGHVAGVVFGRRGRSPGTHRRPTGRPSHTLLCSSNHLYSARMTLATIIKPRSLWIVRSDNSTFVIQLQINPFCSAL